MYACMLAVCLCLHPCVSYVHARSFAHVCVSVLARLCLCARVFHGLCSLVHKRLVLNLMCSLK